MDLDFQFAPKGLQTALLRINTLADSQAQQTCPANSEAGLSHLLVSGKGVVMAVRCKSPSAYLSAPARL